MGVATAPVATRRAEVSLFVDPLSWHFERDGLFDSRSSPYGGDNILEPYTYLRSWFAERGVPVHTADLLERGDVPPADVNVYVTMGLRDRYPRLAERGDVELSAFFVPECPIAEPRLYLDLHKANRVFKRMFSFSEDAALRPFLKDEINFRPFRFPQAFNGVNEQLWRRANRSFLVMINANKLPRIAVRELYTERLRAVEYFNRRGEIDLYGIGWEGPPMRVGTTRVPGAVRRLHHYGRLLRHRVYPSRDPLYRAARAAARGPVVSKIETLAGYTFAVCFENMVLEGWITEKIFDCFFAGTVPVYLGAPDIERWIPKECFVDMRDFSGYEEVGEFLHSLDERSIEQYRVAARDFLASDRFAPFSKQAFTQLFADIVEEDAGVSL